MKRLLIVVLVLAVLGGGGAWIDRQRQRQHSVLSGFFENQPVEVSSRITGRVARIEAREGQSVAAGAVLVKLEAVPTQRQTRASQATAEEARQQYLELRHGPRPEDIRRQEAVVAELAANLEKLRRGPRPQEIAEARAAERAASARLAQARRGPTREERAQLKARYNAARVEERVARNDAKRYARLFQEDEVSRQIYEREQADARQAADRRRDAQEAWVRARMGTPHEELEQARQERLQATAALHLILAGTRREDLEAARARLDEARTALDELRAGSRGEQIARARAAARAARASAQSAAITLSERVVRAPQAGVVDRIPVAVGDLVGAGTTLVRMSDPTDIWIRVYVPENRLAQIQVGATADLQVDGIPDVLAGRVDSVDTRGEFTPANLQSPEERGKQVFAVRLRLQRPDARVKAGMLATVTRIGGWWP